MHKQQISCPMVGHASMPRSQLEARAAADAASMGDRLGDELRAQIVSLSAEVTQRLLAETLDDAAQQQMIEGFIQKVGSSS